MPYDHPPPRVCQSWSAWISIKLAANFIGIDFNEPLKQHLESALLPLLVLPFILRCDRTDNDYKTHLRPETLCGDTEQIVIGGGRDNEEN